jgi:hypothetical protein
MTRVEPAVTRVRALSVWGDIRSPNSPIDLLDQADVIKPEAEGAAVPLSAAYAMPHELYAQSTLSVALQALDSRTKTALKTGWRRTRC